MNAGDIAVIVFAAAMFVLAAMTATRSQPATSSPVYILQRVLVHLDRQLTLIPPQHAADYYYWSGRARQRAALVEAIDIVKACAKIAIDDRQHRDRSVMP